MAIVNEDLPIRITGNELVRLFSYIKIKSLIRIGRSGEREERFHGFTNVVANNLGVFAGSDIEVVPVVCKLHLNRNEHNDVD